MTSKAVDPIRLRGSSVLSHETPQNITLPQTITIRYNGVNTTFIFGSKNNNTLYKYDYKSEKYMPFDKYVKK